MRYIYLFFCILIVQKKVTGQDAHFSQFYSSPTTLNPALTGLFYGDYRISSTYRSQWQSVSTPFTTGTIAFDTRAARNIFKEQNIFGIGGLALFDQSNNGGLKARYLAMSVGYNQQLDDLGYSRLGIGFQVSYVSKSIDYNKFLFSRQFTPSSPSGFDPTLPTGEAFSTIGINYADYGTGILYSGINGQEKQWYIGASYYHITQPNESFTAQEVRLAPRITVHAGYNYPTNNNGKMYFSGLYMQSAISNEYMLGGVLQSFLDYYEKKSSIMGGMYYRWDESIIPYVGLESGDFQFGVSYDINISALKTASQFRGGFELSMQYVFAKDPSRNLVPKCFNKF